MPTTFYKTYDNQLYFATYYKMYIEFYDVFFIQLYDNLIFIPQLLNKTKIVNIYF